MTRFVRTILVLVLSLLATAGAPAWFSSYEPIPDLIGIDRRGLLLGNSPWPYYALGVVVGAAASRFDYSFAKKKLIEHGPKHWSIAYHLFPMTWAVWLLIGALSFLVRDVLLDMIYVGTIPPVAALISCYPSGNRKGVTSHSSRES